MGSLGRGIFEVTGAGAAGEDVAAPKAELDWMRRLSAEIHRPVTFALLQVDAAPELWRELLALSEAAAKDGARVYPQVAGRPFGMLVGHQTKIHPFGGRPSYEKLLALPFAERIRRLRNPETKRAILAEGKALPSLLLTQLHKFFPMGPESGPYLEVIDKYGLTARHIVKAVNAVLKRKPAVKAKRPVRTVPKPAVKVASKRSKAKGDRRRSR